jgi:hypothetical protein
MKLIAIRQPGTKPPPEDYIIFDFKLSPPSFQQSPNTKCHSTSPVSDIPVSCLDQPSREILQSIFSRSISESTSGFDTNIYQSLPQLSRENQTATMTNKKETNLAAKQRLMTEYKGLEKEKWVNIEVCSPSWCCLDSKY